MLAENEQRHTLFRLAHVAPAMWVRNNMLFVIYAIMNSFEDSSRDELSSTSHAVPNRNG
jgi:hypothetical protein